MVIPYTLLYSPKIINNIIYNFKLQLDSFGMVLINLQQIHKKNKLVYTQIAAPFKQITFLDVVLPRLV